MRLKSDLLDVLEAVVDERLDTVTLEWDPRPAVTVVMASEGYPGHYERERLIQNLEAADRMPDVKVFHAGTTLRGDAGHGPRRPDRHRRRPRPQRDRPGRPSPRPRPAPTKPSATIKFPGAWYRRDIAGRLIRAGR